MKSVRTTTSINHPPVQGWAAFVRGYRAVTVKSLGMGPFDSLLDRDENKLHPGEESA